MSRVRNVKVAASLAALGSLIIVAIAGAAAWQGPWTVSNPGVDAGDATHPPQISVGASGDATVGWWEPSGVFVARKRAGQGFSAPLIISDPSAATSIYPGVDGAGNTTTAWSVLGTAIISYWPVGDPVATSHPVGGLEVTDFKVNASGAAVLAGTNGTDVIVGYREAGGSFTFDFHRISTPGFTYVKPRVAINAAGTAVVIYRDTPGTGLWAAVRPAGSDWAPSETVTALPVFDTAEANPSVAIDGAGNVFAAFAYTVAAGQTVVHTALRPPGGGWQESPDLSENAAGFQANFVSVVVNASGSALLVWDEFTGISNIQARYGSTGTGIWGPIETVNDAGADAPVAAISDDGRAVVAWERQLAAGNNVGQARVREPGPSGAFWDIRTLSLSHANVTFPSIGTDGNGDFATVSAPYDGTAKSALVSAYDAAPPALSDITVSGTQLAGDPVGLAVSASDAWSAVGAPVWTFSDGGTATGASVTHAALPNTGSFTAHVTVSDSSGNSASKDIVVGVFSSVSSLTSAKFTAKWSMSKLIKGSTLLVEGVVPRAGSYSVDATLGKQRRMHVTLKLPAGKFSRKLKLPAKLLPGTYKIDLVPAASEVRPATQNAKLKAPREGVVSVLYTSATRDGPPARTLVRARNVYATFIFAALPAGNITVRWFHLIGKKRIPLTPIIKPRLPKIVSGLGPFNLKGTYQVVIFLKKVPIASTQVTFKR